MHRLGNGPFIKTTVESLSRKHGLETRRVYEVSKMKIANSPSQLEAMTGLVYVSPYNNVGPYVMLDDSEIYRVVPHAGVDVDTIALNAIQRRLLVKFAGDEVQVSNIHIPMDKEFTFEILTVTAEYVKSYPGHAFPDSVELANAFKTQFEGHVLQPEQKVIMQHNNENFLLTVQSDMTGLVCNTTRVSINF